MRETLTYLAAAVLAVLALALAVPPFIDWTAYGAALGARLGQALDADVRLGGPISIRLLPSPHFQTGALRVSRPGLDVQADGASLELSLAPLLRGSLTIASARLDRPQIAIDTTTAGAAPVFGDLGIDRLALRDASFLLTAATGSRRLDHVDAIVSAESANGPFRAQGFVRVENRLLPFRAATGAINNGLLAVKIDVDPLAGLPKGEAAGVLTLDRQPRFAGSLAVSGEIEGAARNGSAFPWHAKFDGTASVERLQADKVDLRAGGSAQWTASGAGRLDGNGLALSLTSERPDFDRVFAVFDPSRLAASLAAGARDRTFAIDWRADASVLGGEVVSDAHVALSRRPGDAPGITRADLGFAVTRGGVVSYKGDLRGLEQASGHLALRGDDAPALARWMKTLSPGLKIPDVPFSTADIAGEVELDPARIAIRDLRAVIDRSSFTGRMDYATGRGAPKLGVDLKADALDLDALPDLGGLGRQMAGVDLAVALEARAIRLARVGRASVEAGHISLAVTRIGDTLSLDRLSLDNLGGATLRAHGKIGAKEAHIETTLDARQLGDLTALLRRVAPGALSEALAARARLLEPATLDVAVDAKSTGDGAFVPTQLTATGKLAGTGLKARLAPRADTGALDGILALDAPEAAPFLRQFGVPVIPLRGQGGVTIEAKLSGRPDAPPALTASGTIAGAAAHFDGVARFDAEALDATGTLKVASRDLGTLLRIVAMPVDTFAGWPADLSAHVALRGGRIAARNIAGRIGGVSVSGSLSRDGDGPVTGALHLDRLDAVSLAGVLLGPPQTQKSGKRWSALAFAPQPNDPPDAAIDLSVDRLMFGGIEATKAVAKLAIRAGVIEAREARMTLAGGVVAGSAALRRQDKTASFDTSLKADGVVLKLPWFSGRFSGHIDVAGAGTSPAALIGSLGGQGVLRIADAEIARADIDAPVRVARAADAEEIPLEPRAIDVALARGFDAGPQRLPALEQVLSIAGGQGAVAPFDLAIGTTRARLDMRYDFASDRVELHEALHPAWPQDWAGASPPVTLSLAGPSGAPVRTIDATDLIATLAGRGIEREQARIAAMEADQRERTFFNRRLKFDRALEAERKAEEARAEAARQEALRQEAARQETIRREAARQDALRQEAARREAQRARESEIPAGTAPLDVRPPAATRSGGVPSIIAPDPGTAGRY